MKKQINNKIFWKVPKLLRSSKDASNESITLVEDSNVVDNSKKTEAILNSFFCNIENLSIPQYNENRITKSKDR